jgi:colanic acid biosynthesis glycosyl transferase WcaI
MRINLWSINYEPEVTGIGVYNTQLCKYLHSVGDDVRVVTAFPYYPTWRKATGDGYKLYRNEMHATIPVHRCWQFVPHRPTVLKRIIHEASFVFSSTLRQLTLPAPDLYFVVSPPLLLGFAAWLVAAIKNRPFVFHVQDLQPDAAANLQMMKRGTFLNILFALEKFAYRNATLVSAISQEMCQAIRQKGIDGSKVIFFPNSIDFSSLQPLPGRGQWRASRDIDESKMVVSYSGNMGVKQGLNLVVQAAAALKDTHPEILFVLTGDGADRASLVQQVEQMKLKNIHMEGVLSEEDHTALLVDSEVCLITQLPGTAASFLPSKLLKILALQRPVVANADVQTPLHTAITEAGFGVAVSPNDPSELAEAIVNLLADNQKRLQMGAAGKGYVAQFDESRVLPQLRMELAKHCHATA